jgi:hypothetical protein
VLLRSINASFVEKISEVLPPPSITTGPINDPSWKYPVDV